MTQDQKDQYSDLQATAAALRDEVEQARNQIEQLNKAKEEFNRDISSTQVIRMLFRSSVSSSIDYYLILLAF